jgi:hypothetical protein
MLPIDVAENQQFLALLCKAISDLEPTVEGRNMLMSLGMENRDQKAVIRLNGRPFNMTDAEHILRLLDIIVQKTIGDRSILAQPISSAPEYHPVNIRRGINPAWNAKYVTLIMEDAIRATESLVAKGSCCLPDLFLLGGDKQVQEEWVKRYAKEDEDEDSDDKATEDDSDESDEGVYPA